MSMNGARKEVDESTQIEVATGRTPRHKLGSCTRIRSDKTRLWREVHRRWAVAGVLAAVTLAVLAPRLGAPGGNYLHAH